MFEYRQANLLTAEKELCATYKKKKKKPTGKSLPQGC